MDFDEGKGTNIAIAFLVSWLGCVQHRRACILCVCALAGRYYQASCPPLWLMHRIVQSLPHSSVQLVLCAHPLSACLTMPRNSMQCWKAIVILFSEPHIAELISNLMYSYVLLSPICPSNLSACPLAICYPIHPIE